MSNSTPNSATKATDFKTRLIELTAHLMRHHTYEFAIAADDDDARALEIILDTVYRQGLQDGQEIAERLKVEPYTLRIELTGMYAQEAAAQILASVRVSEGQQVLSYHTYAQCADIVLEFPDLPF